MKKVSEVQKELKALGCNEKVATDLLVACGILEENKEVVKVGQVWKMEGENKYHVVTSLRDGNGHGYCTFYAPKDVSPVNGAGQDYLHKNAKLFRDVE